MQAIIDLLQEYFQNPKCLFLIACLAGIYFVYEKVVLRSTNKLIEALKYDIDKLKEKSKEQELEILQQREKIANLEKNNRTLKIKLKELNSITNTDYNPTSHLFFTEIREHLVFESEYPIINNKAMQLIMINMLRIKLKYWYLNYLSFFRKQNISRTTFSLPKLEKCIIETVEKYKDIWVEYDVPVYIIDEFNKKHDEKVYDMLRQMKKTIRENPNKPDQFYIEFLLQYSLVLLKATIKDVERSVVKLKESDYCYKRTYPKPDID